MRVQCYKRQELTWLGFPISLLLIAMIYTSTWALRYLSIPVYTIFKNLTIILIAYGEVLWFGGAVSSMALFSFGLMVLSSIIAAWADIKHALDTHGTATGAAATQLATLNTGYIWMMFNCLSTASYVLYMRKRIKLTNFKDFDSKCQRHVMLYSANSQQPCFITMFLLSLSSSSHPSLSKTGPLPTSRKPSLPKPVTASSRQ